MGSILRSQIATITGLLLILPFPTLIGTDQAIVEASLRAKLASHSSSLNLRTRRNRTTCRAFGLGSGADFRAKKR
jgi:hypothetical protein